MTNRSIKACCTISKCSMRSPIAGACCVGSRPRCRGGLCALLFGCSSSAAADDGAAGSASATGGDGRGRNQQRREPAPRRESGGSNSDCTTIPEETGGPYPGDGSNGPNA